MSRKEVLAKDLKDVLSKEIGAKNPIFSTQHIEELHSLFSLYSDPRQRRVNVKDMLMTAKTLGLDEKYDIVFRVLHDVAENGTALNFEQFLKILTAKIGNPFTEQARGANFALYDLQGKGELTLDELRYVNEQFRYNFSDDQLVEIIHAVGGFNAETITFQKFSRYIEKKVARRKVGI